MMCIVGTLLLFNLDHASIYNNKFKDMVVGEDSQAFETRNRVKRYKTILTALCRTSGVSGISQRGGQGGGTKGEAKGGGRPRGGPKGTPKGEAKEHKLGHPLIYHATM